MEQIKTADNGKNNGVNATKIIKGVDGLILPNARELTTKQERVVLKRFFDDFCKIKDDGTIHCVINNDYMQFFKTTILHLSLLDADTFSDTSKNLFARCLTACVNSCLKLRAKQLDKSSDLNSWQSILQGVGVVTFVKQFILAYMHITNTAIVEYNQKFTLVNADALREIKQANNFAMWQQIRIDLGLIEKEKDGE